MAKRGRKPKITPDTSKMMDAANLLVRYMAGTAEEKAATVKDAEKIAKDTEDINQRIAAKEQEITDKEKEIAQLKNELAQLKASAQGASKATSIIDAIMALYSKK